MKPELNLIEGGGSVVAFIEIFLEKAKRGELRTLAIAAVHNNGDVATGITWSPDREAHRYYPTLGAISQLQHNILSGELSFPTED